MVFIKRTSYWGESQATYEYQVQRDSTSINNETTGSINNKLYNQIFTIFFSHMCGLQLLYSHELYSISTLCFQLP